MRMFSIKANEKNSLATTAATNAQKIVATLQ